MCFADDLLKFDGKVCLSRRTDRFAAYVLIAGELFLFFSSSRRVVRPAQAQMANVSPICSMNRSNHQQHTQNSFVPRQADCVGSTFLSIPSIHTHTLKWSEILSFLGYSVKPLHRLECSSVDAPEVDFLPLFEAFTFVEHIFHGKIEKAMRTHSDEIFIQILCPRKCVVGMNFDSLFHSTRHALCQIDTFSSQSLYFSASKFSSFNAPNFFVRFEFILHIFCVCADFERTKVWR